jgi:hypothetical protein
VRRATHLGAVRPWKAGSDAEATRMVEQARQLWA